MSAGILFFVAITPVSASIFTSRSRLFLCVFPLFVSFQDMSLVKAYQEIQDDLSHLKILNYIFRDSFFQIRPHAQVLWICTRTPLLGKSGLPFNPRSTLSSIFSSQQKSLAHLWNSRLCIPAFHLINKKFKVLLLFFLLTVFLFSLPLGCHQLFVPPGDTEIRDTQALRAQSGSQFTHYESTF